jgi:hypothetical protein
VSQPDRPQPAYFSGDELILQGELSGLQRILLYDLNGRLVFEIQKQFSGADPYSISLEGYYIGPGIYLLQTVSTDGIYTRKILKTE